MLETLVMGSALDVELLPQSTMKPSPIMHTARKLHVLPFAFDSGSMEYVEQPLSAGGGGGGAVTIADGADIAEGSTGDAAYVSGSGTVVSILKGIFGRALLLDATFTGRINTQGQKTMAASTPVVLASDQSSIPVSATLAAAIPAGTNNIGDVDVLSLPSLPAGANNIGDVDVLTLPALPTGANTIGGVNLTQYTPSAGRLPIELDAAALAALETITVAAISAALPAGTNNIGDVDVLTVPADPFGVNADAASATGSISAKLRFISATGIPVTALPALPAGNNNIGDVDVASLPALVAGTANIGDVDLIPGQVGITGGAGATAANTPRVVQALDPLTAAGPAAASVGVASAAVLVANAARKAAVFTNTSDNVISLAFGAAAVLNSGITLFPGGALNMTRDNFFHAGEIRAIASAAASNLAIQEFT